MRVETIVDYTPEQRKLREEYIALIEAEKRAMLKRVQPYLDALTGIENAAGRRYIVLPE